MSFVRIFQECLSGCCRNGCPDILRMLVRVLQESPLEQRLMKIPSETSVVQARAWTRQAEPNGYSATIFQLLKRKNEL